MTDGGEAHEMVDLGDNELEVEDWGEDYSASDEDSWLLLENIPKFYMATKQLSSIYCTAEPIKIIVKMAKDNFVSVTRHWWLVEGSQVVCILISFEIINHNRW